MSWSAPWIATEFVQSTKLTFGEWIVDWLKKTAPKRVSATIDECERIAENYIST